MLPKDLKFINIPGDRKRTPTIEKLRSDYFVGANISAETESVNDLDKDMQKVITLKPESTPFYRTKIKNPINRGYFAYGSLEDTLATFEIFVPHSSVKGNFPPKELRTAIAILSTKLIEEGYSILPKGITYTTEMTNK